MEFVYELNDVTKSYGQVTAIDHIDLTVEPGEFTAIVGPSGSGKTSLLQLLGALDRPTSGEVLFEGRDLARLRDAELTRLRATAIGFVFQQFNLIPTVTARENITLALAPSGLGSQGRRERVEELLGTVGLEKRGHHIPSKLSGGEQQRIAIARALANEPRVLLADEPTGNLDSKTGAEIIELLRLLSDDRGQTVIVITHDPSIAARTSRVIRMQDGRVSGDLAAV
ncbi:MAG TPA: ABC transporter ATP-binding protein [Gaiellaceae bacterium]|nr:ABC transporter ATP-binding protein [Gaiellaceae bacterium]